MAPINQIPPEILSLIPDFFVTDDDNDQDLIALTHVCRAWRDAFVSRPSLWTDLGYVGLDKTRVYLERSKSSLINLSLDDYFVKFSDPALKLIASTTGRLRSLEIYAESRNLQLISTCLSRPAPLLKTLSIRSYGGSALPSALFNGDLSPLHNLHLEQIDTELPWRNMANLTSFVMGYKLPPVSVSQLIDFLESAPRLREIDILSSSPISGARNGRLVSLASLQRMNTGGHPSSHLFDHLLIPVGVRLKMGVAQIPSPTIDGRRPRFIDNLGNLSNFTTIKLICKPARMEFSGPNGVVSMVSQDHRDRSLLEPLALFDTSKTERLELERGEYRSSNPIYQALLPMKGLRTLRFDWNVNFIRALDPTVSPSGTVVCPILEELVIVVHWEFDIKDIVRTAVARETGGAKLKTVTIIKEPKIEFPELDVLELGKHVLHVKFDHASANGGGDSDEEG